MGSCDIRLRLIREEASTAADAEIRQGVVQQTGRASIFREELVLSDETPLVLRRVVADTLVMDAGLGMELSFALPAGLAPCDEHRADGCHEATAYRLVAINGQSIEYPSDCKGRSALRCSGRRIEFEEQAYVVGYPARNVGGDWLPAEIYLEFPWAYSSSSTTSERTRKIPGVRLDTIPLDTLR